LREYIWECLNRMYVAFERARPQVAPERIIDVHYEDLARDIVATVEGVYAQLGLGDFERVRGKLQERVRSEADYQVNQHQLDPALEAEILQRWGSYARRYGYAEETAPARLKLA
jgi:hypothetical protein